VAGLEHPKSVYVRETAIVPKLDECLGTLFDPENMDAICETLSMTGGHSAPDNARSKRPAGR
jgi:hypothetical protein